MEKNRVFLFRIIAPLLPFILLAAPVHGHIIFEGDGSQEPGFVDPREKEGDPPPAPPEHISSGEETVGAAYLAAPLSRSEKKKPPAPPVLFTKLSSPYGPIDWASRPNDLNNLLTYMKEVMDVDFRHDVRSLSEIDTNPENNPILYRSGHFHFSFDD